MSAHTSPLGALSSYKFDRIVHVHDSARGLQSPPTRDAIGSGPREHGSSQDDGFVKASGTVAAPQPRAGLTAFGKILANAHYIGDRNPWTDLQDSDSDTSSSLFEDSFEQVSSSHLSPSPAFKSRATRRRVSKAALKAVKDKQRSLTREYFYGWLFLAFKANKGEQSKEVQDEFLSRAFVALGPR